MAACQEIIEQRNNATFGVTEMGYVCWENQEMADLMKSNFQEYDKNFQFDPEYFNLSREQKMVQGVKRFRKISEYDNQQWNYNIQNSQRLNYFSWQGQFPSGVSQVMVVPCITNLATEKQKEVWLPKLYSYEWVGCYCQTEIAHGSDVQSLQTTATYDRKTQQFVINTPSNHALQWWVGELGIYASHALVFAQLIIAGKQYGVQSFFVQIRDYKTHSALPGIELGDIGPQHGFDTQDNGFARFVNVRVPRDNMLMRFSQVSQQGQFSHRGNPQIGYATMMLTRNAISCEFPQSLGQSLCISIRYSIMRTQFREANGKKERKILDYQTQQEKLLPAIADLYAIIISGYKIQNMCFDNIKRIQEKNDFSINNEIHNILCGAKAISSEYTLTHLQVSRMSCGGHGYSYLSGLPGLVDEFSPNVTLEGENTIMLLQVARFLLKCIDKAVQQKQLPNSAQYMAEFEDIPRNCLVKSSFMEFDDLQVLRHCLKFNAISQVQRAANQMLEGIAGKEYSMKKTWDVYAGIDLIDASRAHHHYLIFEYFAETAESQTNQEVKLALFDLLKLFSIQQIINYSQGFDENQFFSSAQYKMMRQFKEEILMPKIRKNALAYVEAFGFQDAQLRSAIAKQTGQPYETLLEWAQTQNSINTNPPVEAIELVKKLKTIKPQL